MRVVVVRYDPRSPEQFRAVRDDLASELAGVPLSPMAIDAVNRGTVDRPAG